MWPAAIVLLAFTWLELVSPDSGSPVTLGLAALVYTLGMLAAMAYAGRETGLAVFDAFTPYNRLLLGDLTARVDVTTAASSGGDGFGP